MKRIDTATKAVDLFGAGKHGFKDGNKSLGIAATDLDASIFNNVQEEICRVIEAAGIALDGAVYNQLLLALRAAGVFTTPAQYDNTTKAATAEFVNRVGNQFSRLASLPGTAVLTNSEVGGIVSVASATASNITLPSTSGVREGAEILIVSIGAGATTLVASSGDITTRQDGVTSTLVLSAGESALMVRVANEWRLEGGSLALKYAACFGSSLGSSGWKKIPDPNSPTGYLILQWGTIAKTTTTSPLAVTFPITFPNTCLRVWAGIGGAVNPNGGPVSSSITSASGFNAYTTSGQAGQSIEYFANGY